MASRTDSSSDSSSSTRKVKSLRAPSLKLKRASALLYNYIKPISHCSAMETHLFQKVSTVLGAMSDIEKAAMLRPERITRSDVPDSSAHRSIPNLNRTHGYRRTERGAIWFGARLLRFKGYKSTIQTEGPLPAPQHARPAGPAKREIIDQTIEQLLVWDFVEKSSSTTASPIVMVWQNNKWRFCVDFRQLNSITAGDAYPMLRVLYPGKRL
ncbi:hypothetical protein BGX38DRAFT_1148840 [Terfezia claveryi]|nr:hypothetical protein BGX38DRAFT_1148840 [Terfezia claveryi]